MRIALFSPYALSVFGGVQEQALAMSRELSSRGHEVLLLAPDSSDQRTYDTPATVVKVGKLLSLPANGSKAPLTLSWSAAKRAEKIVREFRPDVVHFHEPFAPLVGWKTLRAHATPAVATFHRSGGGPAVQLTRPLLQFLARGIDESVAVSELARRTMGEASGLAPQILFNGFEIDRFSKFPRIVPDATRIVTVGRLENRKGVHVLVQAVRSHNQQSPQAWQLDIIGDGPERSRLEELAKQDPNIVFHGALDDDAKQKLVRGSTVFVAPALFGESFGMVLLEAMASMVPVIASNIDGYREASGNLAVLFEAGNADDLERSISEVVSGARSVNLEGALEQARKWSMSTLIDRYLAIYDEAIRHFGSTN